MPGTDIRFKKVLFFVTVEKFVILQQNLMLAIFYPYLYDTKECNGETE